MKILIVDDDPNLRDLVTIALERAGHGTVTASDGQRALTEAARAAPDLIVLDVGLPELDGFEVCRRLRGRGDDVPVLFLTARDDEID
ncbi:MAG: response regulator, partial [Pseudomonadota bacterium]